MSLSDDVFEIKTKYHNFIVIPLILTHILSYQDGIIVRSSFLPIFAKVVGWFWILSISNSFLVETFEGTWRNTGRR